MRISDWSSDVCSSDLLLRKQEGAALIRHGFGAVRQNAVDRERLGDRFLPDIADPFGKLVRHAQLFRREGDLDAAVGDDLIRHVLTIDSAKLRAGLDRSEEHTSELQSLMRNSYAVFCLKKKKKIKHYNT